VGAAPAATGRSREFAFTKRDFDRVRALVSEHSGIRLTEAKEDMVYSRLARRLRVLGLVSFGDYVDYLMDPQAEELVEFVNAITTNLTAFFREPHHFETLANAVLPGLATTKADSRRLRIWSAGCSTGEEPYSIAMVLCEAMEDTLRGWNIKVLASDLDSSVLASAARGQYPLARIQDLPNARKARFFLRGKAANNGQVRARRELQELITFRQLNLMAPWPMRGQFDVIFCRNVVIYFDKDTQSTLFERYAELMPVGGWLFIGHSESLHRVSERFELVGRTTYRKVC